MLVSVFSSVDRQILHDERGSQPQLGHDRLREHQREVFAQFELDLIPDHVHQHPLEIDLEDCVLNLLVGNQVIAVGVLDAAFGGAAAGDEQGLGADAALADGVVEGVFDRHFELARADKQSAKLVRQIRGNHADLVGGTELAHRNAQIDALEG